MSATETRRLTLDEFRALPEGPPYYEFEEGKLIPLPSPTYRHQKIVMKLSSALDDFVLKQNSGVVFMEVDVTLPDGRVFIPDFGFLSTDQQKFISPLDGKVHGAPTLVVEVLSTDEARDRAHKFHIYYDNQVAWFWLISQSLLIEEYQATPQGYVRVSSVAFGEEFHPKLFPDLTLNLASLLGEPREPSP
jgi:Uma2 family endonuclease